MSVSDKTKVWRCRGCFPSGDGGIYHETKYAKTEADMLILLDKGYDQIHELTGEKVADDRYTIEIRNMLQAQGATP